MGHRLWQFQTGNDSSSYQMSNKEANIIFIGQGTTQNNKTKKCKEQYRYTLAGQSMPLKITNLSKNNLDAK